MAKKLDPYYLSEPSLIWAVNHLDRFGDTDILPVPIEFKAVTKNRTTIAQSLATIDLNRHQYRVPRRISVPKAIGGFRVASQLAPIDSILYTALAHKIAPKVESARLPLELKASCSYRLSLQENGQFFVPGFGFEDFNRSTDLHIQRPGVAYILSVDLADFYNQISHHRIANNMESSGFDKSDYETAEHILDRFASNHHSRGLPIGPTASVIFAELASLDIDSFILGKGVKFCRYVDDFRFFFETRDAALCFLAHFTEVLFTNHRLATNTTKTRLWSKDSFDNEIIDEDSLEEEKQKDHLMRIIRSRSESCAPPDDDDDASDEERNEATRNAIDELFERVEGSEPLPTGLAKFVLHRARTLKTTMFATRLLDNLDHFLPVVGDVVNYITAVDPKNRKGYLKKTYEWLSKDSVISDCAFMHEWAAHMSAASCTALFSQWDQYEGSTSSLPDKVSSKYAPLAAARLNQWGHIRLLKERIDSYDESSKRAIILSSCVLGEDEKRHWLSRFDQSGDAILDSCTQYARNNRTI